MNKLGHPQGEHTRYNMVKEGMKEVKIIRLLHIYAISFTVIGFPLVPSTCDLLAARVDCPTYHVIMSKSFFLLG